MAYEPIPVAAAAEIAERYGKDQVLIFAWDRGSGMMHRTTWGRTADDKLQAAQGGDRVAEILCDRSKEVMYEDFRERAGEPSRTEEMENNGRDGDQ